MTGDGPDLVLAALVSADGERLARRADRDARRRFVAEQEAAEVDAALAAALVLVSAPGQSGAGDGHR